MSQNLSSKNAKNFSNEQEKYRKEVGKYKNALSDKYVNKIFNKILI